MNDPVKEIIVPRSHHSDFMAHGPGRGAWWAWQFFDPEVQRNTRVAFVLQHAALPHLRRVDALVLHVEKPRTIRDCDRLGVPGDFIGWTVVFYDGRWVETKQAA